MLDLALKNRKKMKPSLFEIGLGKKTGKESRTIETIKALKKRFPKHEFYWVIGSNLVKEMKKWKSFKELIHSTKFVVVPIKGNVGWRKEKWLKENNAVIVPQKCAVKPISSREIRKRVKQGEPLAGLVPPSVEEFVKEKMLFLSPFAERVFLETMKIPRGKISTYKEIAKAIGRPKASRAVGNSLNKNRCKKVPCHRVVKSSGKIGGFASGGKKKAKMLKSEGIAIKKGKIRNFNKLIVKAQELKKLNSRN